MEKIMSIKIVPDIIIGRLPIYLRALQSMRNDQAIPSSENDKDVTLRPMTTSSQELGESVGISAAQIRKDLSQFGGFGTQGTGYRIDELIKELKRILKLEKDWSVAVVGAGDMGHALSRYQGFKDRGFTISAVFDNNPELIGKKIGDLTIQSMETMAEVLKMNNTSIAMLTVPASAAQTVTDQLVKAGVRAILNYAPTIINVPDHVVVQYIDPSIHLQRMTYYLEENS
jgi:redox-sensing transcriptional repressor